MLRLKIMDLFFSKETYHQASKLSQSLQRSQVHKEQPVGGPQERKVNVPRPCGSDEEQECVQGTERRPFCWSFVSKGRKNGLRWGFQKA